MVAKACMNIKAAVKRTDQYDIRRQKIQKKTAYCKSIDKIFIACSLLFIQVQVLIVSY